MLTTRFGGYDVRKVKIIDPTLAGDKIVAGQRDVTPQLEVVRMGLDFSCVLTTGYELRVGEPTLVAMSRLLARRCCASGYHIILFGLHQ